MKQGTTAYARHEQLVAEARAYKAQGHTHEEVAERFGKSEQWSRTYCKGIASQTYLRGNQYTSGKFDRIANAKRIIAEHNPQFEYVGGFTNVDAPVIIRCKVCGTERSASMVSLRKDNSIVCHECIRRAAEQRKQREKNAKSFKVLAHKFNIGKQASLQFCEVCGAPIERGHICPECAKNRHKRRDNLKKEKRRVAALTKESAGISLARLYKRDGGVCWICGGHCDYSADINDNAYPSIDHVVPISKGGKDEWSNIRLAHRICNSRRGNRLDI